MLIFTSVENSFYLERGLLQTKQFLAALYFRQNNIFLWRKNYEKGAEAQFFELRVVILPEYSHNYYTLNVMRAAMN
jgi:hypothetical protein